MTKEFNLIDSEKYSESEYESDDDKNEINKNSKIIFDNKTNDEDDKNFDNWSNIKLKNKILELSCEYNELLNKQCNSMIELNQIHKEYSELEINYIKKCAEYDAVKDFNDKILCEYHFLLTSSIKKKK